MKAIETRYIGPTNTKGARIVAADSDGNRVTIGYPHELSGEAVHRKAAEALRDKMGWTGELIAGGTEARLLLRVRVMIYAWLLFTSTISLLVLFKLDSRRHAR
jgi:hypothetical protein